MTLSYDTQAGLLATTFKWKHSVVGDVFSSFSFWCFLAIHLAVFWVARWNREALQDYEDIFLMDWNGVKVVSGITTFIEVFYAQHAYQRYLHLYSLVRDIFLLIYEVSHYSRVYLGDIKRGHARAGLRFIIVSMALALQDLKDTGTEGQLLELGRQGLLREPELSTLLPLAPGNRPRVVLTWAAGTLRAGFEESNASRQAMQGVCDLVMRIQALQRAIINIVRLPVPFQYFHLLSAMIIMNLLLWAVKMGMLDCAFAPVIYTFSSFIFIAMMELSSQLADPFGTDEVDFPINKWMQHCVSATEFVLELQWPFGPSLESFVEQEVALKPATLRNFAWQKTIEEGEYGDSPGPSPRGPQRNSHHIHSLMHPPRLSKTQALEHQHLLAGGHP